MRLSISVCTTAAFSPERVLHSVAVDVDRCHQHQFTGHVDALHNQQVELGYVRGILKVGLLAILFAWSVRMEGYGGPAQPSPTIAMPQRRNGMA